MEMSETEFYAMLDDATEVIEKDTRPKNSFTVSEYWQHRQAQGESKSAETYRSQIEAAVKRGDIERHKVGRRIYYVHVVRVGGKV